MLSPPHTQHTSQAMLHTPPHTPQALLQAMPHTPHTPPHTMLHTPQAMLHTPLHTPHTPQENKHYSRVLILSEKIIQIQMTFEKERKNEMVG
jgi:hypothetical protein